MAEGVDGVLPTERLATHRDLLRQVGDQLRGSHRHRSHPPLVDMNESQP